MNILLKFGCWGREHNGLMLCAGVSNTLMDLTKQTERNREISNYLDTMGLYDRPVYGNIHTIIFRLQNDFSVKGNVLFEEAIYKTLEEFCILHKKCGLYLKLEMEDV